MDNCLFCRIRDKEIKSKIIYEDEAVIAFNDINPQAPVHVLIISKEHIDKISSLNEKNSLMAAKMIIAAKKIARENNIETDGYRLVFNCGPNAGQAVFHIHLHLLGGRKMGWPPG